MSTMNRKANCHNPYQGRFKKVLCVCSAGLLRSPTAAWVLSQEPFNYNTRAAGVSEEYALIHADDVMLEWSDEIVVMERAHLASLVGRTKGRTVVCLDIPDEFEYRDLRLVDMIKKKYMELTGLDTAPLA